MARPKGSLTIPSLTKPAGKPGPKSKIEKALVHSTVGRPAGVAAKLKELREMLVLGKADAIMAKMVKVALDDAHPGQTTMLKFFGERVLPQETFTGLSNPGQGGITIVVEGMGGQAIKIGRKTTEVVLVEPSEDDEVIDMDFTEVRHETK